MVEYTVGELMCVVAARQLEDNKSVAVGTGLPMAAAMLAQQTHAHNLLIAFEAGGVAPQLPTLPISVGDSRTIHRALMATTLVDIMDIISRGYVDYAFLGGAQIDKFGNLNSTMIGTDHSKPTVRFPGSGGANDFASLAWETMIIMDRHSSRRFVKKVDFITSPGYLDGPGSREEWGLFPGTGPSRVITDLCLFDFHPKTKIMRLIKTHPGVTVDDIKKATGFEFEIAEKVGTNPPPTKEDLRIIHEIIDPNGIIFPKK